MKLIEILVQELPGRGGWPSDTGSIEQGESSRLFDPGKISSPYLFNGRAFPSAEDWQDAIVNRQEYEAALAASKEMLINKPAGVIGRFIPIGERNGRTSFSVKSMEKSNYLAPAWMGEKWDGTRYHVTEKAWTFEPSPEPQAVWNGEGLPPVGCECEVGAEDFDSWTRIRVVYVHNGEIAAVISSDNPYLNDRLEKFSHEYNRSKFRPIRTEAECKRSDICDKIYGALCKAEREGNRSDMAESVYDAIAAGKIPGVKLEASDDH